MKSVVTIGGILGGLLVLGVFARLESGTADAQQPPGAQPNLTSPPRPFPPPAAPPVGTAPAPDLGSKSIEQLIDYITGLKKQRLELEQQEAKAVAILRLKLTEANQKAAQLGGYAEERKFDTKKDLPVKEGLPFPVVRPDDTKKE